MTHNNSEINNSSKVDTYSYKGWLNSDFFLKRAFASFGYQAVASLIILIPIYIIMIMCFLTFGLFLSNFSHMNAYDLDYNNPDYYYEEDH